MIGKLFSWVMRRIYPDPPSLPSEDGNPPQRR